MNQKIETERSARQAMETQLMAVLEERDKITEEVKKKDEILKRRDEELERKDEELGRKDSELVNQREYYEEKAKVVEIDRAIQQQVSHY